MIQFGIKGFCFSQGKTSDVSVPIFKAEFKFQMQRNSY